jgi:hypothetical protein
VLPAANPGGLLAGLVPVFRAAGQGHDFGLHILLDSA